MANPSEAQLLARLPNLPKKTENHLPTSLIIGTTGRLSPRFRLIEQKGDPPWNLYYAPKSGVNLALNNAASRRILTLGSIQDVFLKSLNTGLKGGEDYPILTALLSVGVGVFSAGGGAVFSIMSGAVSAGKVDQPVRARLGDEIWQVEAVGKEGKDIRHMEYFVLVDPYRKSPKSNFPAAWKIHENRVDLRIG